MKHVFWTSCLCVVALSSAGCGEDEAAPAVPRGEKDSGPEPERDSGPNEPAERGPVIEFLAPKAATNPNDDEVLTERMVVVRCKVTRRSGGRPVDAASVEISMDRPLLNGTTEKIKSTAVPREGGEHEASFDVSAMANGPLKFNCSAKDQATTPQSATKSLTTLLDLGPSIEVSSPENTPYALIKPVPIKFKVVPGPLAEDDDDAAVDSVELKVSGLEFDIAESEEAGVYVSSVDFNDRTLFAVAPSAAEILITAKNKRGATRTSKVDIALDGAGPTITVLAPTANTIVHGEITLRVTATDSSGIKPGSLKAVFENVEDREDLVIDKGWRSGPEGSSEYLVDTVKFDDDLNQVTIQVSAEDKVGNLTTKSHMLRLDNMPPVVSLDPPPMREWRKSEDKYYCSTEFDPVGADAASDLQSIWPSQMFRALVEDRTNETPGDMAPKYAGIATDKVDLFVQGDTGTPLLIDKDGDGTCDEINSDPASNRPTKVNLRPLPPRGSAWYPKPPPAYSIQIYNEMRQLRECTNDPNGPESSKSPTPFCGNTAMFRAISGRGEDKPAAIYGLNPTNAEMLNCQGEVWMVEPIAGLGWACLAVRAEDTRENVGVSAPLRVCITSGPGDTTTPCVSGNPEHLTPPTCTDGCTISPGQTFEGLIRQAR